MIMKKKNVKMIRENFIKVSKKFLQRGSSIDGLRSVVRSSNFDKSVMRESSGARTNVFLIVFVLTILSSTIIVKFSLIDDALKWTYGRRCLIPNNYLVWEFTRPVSDCDYCRNVRSAIVLSENTTKTDFEIHAYESRPIIVKKAAKHWPASRVFDLKFFRDLYDNVDGAYETIDEECQFLHFKSNFKKLRDVFEMNERRAKNLEGEESWYVGWKNCHPKILDVMNEFYETPRFLPDDAEIPRTNYVFLGWDQGAIMHLDYIPRLMWQGQIVGSKTWTVAPTPECDNVCEGFDFSVANGDVVLIDTRLWYHETLVENGSFSLTVTSEYG